MMIGQNIGKFVGKCQKMLKNAMCVDSIALLNYVSRSDIHIGKCKGKGVIVVVYSVILDKGN